jgi:hypothetical protein
MPTERLEARICELAGHLTAATCQFLLLVADFDARQGWASWELPSCAAWLAWKCQIAPGTAREHVRVARALGKFPLIRTEFAAGRLSYAKVRALTRIAAPETESDLVQMATPMTAGQLERFARAHRRVTRAEEEDVRSRRKLTWRCDDDRAFSFSGYLPPEAGAVVLQAVRAALVDLEHPHDDDHDDSISAETPAQRLNRQDRDDGTGWDGEDPPRQQVRTPVQDLADALVEVCASYLRSRIVSADNADVYQVIVHAGAEAITQDPEPGGVPAETPHAIAPDVPAETPPPPPAQAPDPPVSHPAYPGRCHLDDGPAISPATLRLIGCNATISTMIHGADGSVLNVGRRSRKPPAALRRAIRERDGSRCQYPGCESRRTDAHHIQYWSNGGETSYRNLCSLCRRHHTLVHDTGVLITVTGNGFAFYTPRGTLIPASPPLPEPAGDITGCHDATITPSTIIPPHSGERLDLHLAIWTCLNNARNQAKRRQDLEVPVPVPVGRLSGVPGAQLGVHPGDDVRGRGARGEDLRDAQRGQFLDVGVRDDAAAEYHDVGRVLLLQQLDHAREQRHVRAGKHGKADRVHVLLDGGRDDLLRRLMQAGVDHLHAGVPQRAGHDLRPPVMAVKTSLRHDHPDLARRSHLHLQECRTHNQRNRLGGFSRRKGCRTARSASRSAACSCRCPSPRCCSPNRWTRCRNWTS